MPINSNNCKPNKCSVCENGEYQPSQGKSLCIQCKAGKFTAGNNRGNKTTCTNCPKGKYGDAIGMPKH